MNFSSLHSFTTVLIILATTCYACTNPGKAPGGYSDGSFSIPNGNTPTYSMGSQMNITWSTTYPSSTLWLISGCNFSNPTKGLVTGNTANYFLWDVSTTSTNSSEVYLIRVVNATGDLRSQLAGGFLSAAFYIAGGPSPSSSVSSFASTSIMSTSSSSSSSSSSILTSSSTSSISPTSSSFTSNPSTTAVSSPELSEGAKAGIGVGVGVGALGAIAAGAFFFFKRKPSTQDSASSNLNAPSYQTNEIPPSQNTTAFVPYNNLKSPTPELPSQPELPSHQQPRYYEM